MNLKTLISKLIKHGGHYLISGLGVTALNVVSLPLYTRLFPPKEFGFYFALAAVSQLLVIPCALYLDSALSRYFYEYRGSAEQHRRFISTYVIFAMGWGSFCFLIFTALSPWLFNRSLHTTYYPFIFLMLLISVSQGFQLILMSLLRMELKSLLLGILNFVYALLIVVLTLALGWELHMGIEARLLSQALLTGLYVLILLVYLYRRGLLIWTFDARIIKEGLRYSLPLLPNTTLGWITSLSDRLLLEFYNMRASIGSYAVGYDLTRTSISLTSDSTAQIYDPLFIREMSNGSHKFLSKHARFFTYYFAIMSIATFSLSIFSWEIIRLLTPKSYAGASAIMPIIAYAYLLGATYKPFITILSFMKKTAVISAIAFASAILNMGLNLIFIPRFGSTAAAWTTLIAVFAYAALTYIFSQRCLKVDYEYIRIAKIIAANGISYALYCGAVASDPPLVFLEGLKILSVAAFPLSLLLLGFFTDTEFYYLAKFKSLAAFQAALQAYRHETNRIT